MTIPTSDISTQIVTHGSDMTITLTHKPTGLEVEGTGQQRSEIDKRLRHWLKREVEFGTTPEQLAEFRAENPIDKPITFAQLFGGK